MVNILQVKREMAVLLHAKGLGDPNPSFYHPQ
jgi:hypothetical protein